MNEEIEQFEKKLAELKPRGLSAGALDRLANTLEECGPSPWRWLGAAAACGIIGIGIWRLVVSGNSAPQIADHGNTNKLVQPASHSVTLGMYQAALQRSETELERLLDQSAQSETKPDESLILYVPGGHGDFRL